MIIVVISNCDFLILKFTLLTTSTFVNVVAVISNCGTCCECYTCCYIMLYMLAKHIINYCEKYNNISTLRIIIMYDQIIDVRLIWDTDYHCRNYTSISGYHILEI